MARKSLVRVRRTYSTVRSSLKQNSLTEEDVESVRKDGDRLAKVGDQVAHIDTTPTCWDVNITAVLVGSLLTEFHPWKEGKVKFCVNPKRKGETMFHVGEDGDG